MKECNIENMSLHDARLIIAALDFSIREITSKQKHRKIAFNKEPKIVSDMKKLKEKMESSKVEEFSVKECLLKYEKERYAELIEEGKTEDELSGAFMYVNEFK